MSETEAPRKTGKWLRSDVPHTGWVCVEVTEGNELCEMCEVTRVSNLHIMVHERWPGYLECGCVCAGFMTEAPAREKLRELLYQWRKAQQNTPIRKLRRRGWSRSKYIHQSNVFGWSHSLKIRGRYKFSPIDEFTVEISEHADGWRSHVYHGSGTHKREIRTSEPFATEVLAAMDGIEWAELLMADQRWVAAECETIAEAFAAAQAKRQVFWDRLRHDLPHLSPVSP